MVTEAVISKWGNSIAVRIPRYMQEELDLNVNEKVELVLKGNAIFIQKPKKARNLNEIILAKTGLTIDEYAKKYPYDGSDYIEFGRVGAEEI